MNAARLPSILIVLAALLAFSATPVSASLPQGPWLDLLELRADQAMEARDYAEVMRVADLYRRAGGEPGIQLRAQEIVAKARHAGNPESAFVPLGQLIVEAGPEHEFYQSALKLYAELEQAGPHPHYRAPGARQERRATVPGTPSRSPLIVWERERQEMEEQARQEAIPLAEAARQEALRVAAEQMEQEQRRLGATRADRGPQERRAREDALRMAYISEVQAAVERRWLAPEGASASDNAIVLVRIDPDTGRIRGFNVDHCSGGETFCASVRETMERLQSLPRPPDAEAVRGGLRIRFSPQS